jgi:hypothetical protein
MAKIDLDTVLLAANGKPFPAATGAFKEDGVTPITEDTTLKLICMNALLVPQAHDSETPNLAYRLYTLAHRIKDGGVIDLDAGQIQVLKLRIEKTVAPWIVGLTWDLLDSREEPVDLPPDAPPPGTGQQPPRVQPQRLPGDG